jgi:hypothetical protein
MTRSVLSKATSPFVPVNSPGSLSNCRTFRDKYYVATLLGMSLGEFHSPADLSRGKTRSLSNGGDAEKLCVVTAAEVGRLTVEDWDYRARGPSFSPVGTITSKSDPVTRDRLSNP